MIRQERARPRQELLAPTRSAEGEHAQVSAGNVSGRSVASSLLDLPSELLDDIAARGEAHDVFHLLRAAPSLRGLPGIRRKIFEYAVSHPCPSREYIRNIKGRFPTSTGHVALARDLTLGRGGLGPEINRSLAPWVFRECAHLNKVSLFFHVFSRGPEETSEAQYLPDLGYLLEALPRGVEHLKLTSTSVSPGDDIFEPDPSDISPASILGCIAHLHRLTALRIRVETRDLGDSRYFSGLEVQDLPASLERLHITSLGKDYSTGDGFRHFVGALGRLPRLKDFRLDLEDAWFIHDEPEGREHDYLTSIVDVLPEQLERMGLAGDFINHGHDLPRLRRCRARLVNLRHLDLFRLTVPEASSRLFPAGGADGGPLSGDAGALNTAAMFIESLSILCRQDATGVDEIRIRFLPQNVSDSLCAENFMLPDGLRRITLEPLPYRQDAYDDEWDARPVSLSALRLSLAMYANMLPTSVEEIRLSARAINNSPLESPDALSWDQDVSERFDASHLKACAKILSSPGRRVVSSLEKIRGAG